MDERASASKSDLIVRVKRRRDDVASESLCIVDQSATSKPRKRANLSSILSKLSTQETKPNQLVLRRLGTIEGGIDLDNATLLRMRGMQQPSFSFSSSQSAPQGVKAEADALIDGASASSQDMGSGRGLGGGDGEESILVNRGKKRLQMSDNPEVAGSPGASASARASGGYLVVEMEKTKTNATIKRSRQEIPPAVSASASASPGGSGGSSSRGGSPTKAGTRIIDPMTRALDAVLQRISLPTLAMHTPVSPFGTGAGGGSADSGVDTHVDTHVAEAYVNDIVSNANASNVNHFRASDGLTPLMATTACSSMRGVNLMLRLGADVGAVDASGRSALYYAHEARRLRPDLGECMKVLLALQNAAAEAMDEGGAGEDGLHDDLDDDYVYDIFAVPPTAGADGLGLMEGQWDAAATAAAALGPAVEVPGLHIGDDDVLFVYDSEWSDLADDEDPDSNDERHFGNDYPDEEEEEGQGFLLKDTGGDEEYADFIGEARTHGDGYGSGDSFDLEKEEDDDDDIGDIHAHGDASFRMMPGKSLVQSLRVGQVVRPQVMYTEDEDVGFIDLGLDDWGKGGQKGCGRGGIPRFGAELSDDERDMDVQESMFGFDRKPPSHSVAYDSDLDGSD